MKKYLSRWNKLTEDEKIMFFDFYMGTESMCNDCADPDKDDNCFLCNTMFPTERLCPCVLYQFGRIKEHPPSVIEYCLIHDGWIEREE